MWRKSFLERRLSLCSLAILALSLSNCAAFAANDASISVSTNDIYITVAPGNFSSASQTITATTDNAAGYTIELETLGSSTALTHQTDSTKTIPTFTLPSGESSIPIASITDGYGYSVDEGANYRPAPEPTSPSQIFKTTTSGSNTHILTFGAKAPTDAMAGAYTNTFNIMVVANLEPCASNSICYYGNNDDGDGIMADQPATSNSPNTLLASNFSRPGYGFAGWNTAINGTGTNYGPNQTITTTDLSVEGLQLYAHWIPSAGTLQDWQGCSDMNIGEVTALTDSRDNNTYAIAKYADGQCWTMENLRLNLSNPNVAISQANTNRPTSDFITAANNHPTSNNSFCDIASATCADQINYNTNNINRNLTASYDNNDTTSSWYSYGVYYNWYTATAGNGTYNFKTEGAITDGDICPAGWHLPTGHGDNSDFARLDIILGGNGTNQASGTTGTNASIRWRSYPLNYIYSGEWRAETGYNRFISGGFSTSNTSNNARASNFWLRPTAINLNPNNSLKYRGQTLRCVARKSQSIIGNIHYDANGGTGTMPNETNVDLTTAIASANAFTNPNSTFVNWNTKADGTGTVVLVGGTVANAANDMGIVDGGTLTLYATWKSVFSIAYDGNNADAGTMTTIHDNIEGNVNLVASNFSRTGYGFAGWSTDATAGDKLLNGQSVTVYGPNQTITVDSALSDQADATNRITLYAVWLPADTSDSMQTFSNTRCESMPTGSILALTDVRDNNTYSIAKLADSNCWMVENLRLDPSTATITTTNTNNPTNDFIATAPSSSSSSTLCGGTTGNNSTCIDQIAYNSDNINRSLPATPTNVTSSSSWYSYGMMYNWYTASAGNGDYAMTSGSTTGDLCPAGWRLPTGGNQGEFFAFNNAVNNGTLNRDAVLRTFPNNLIYSGDYNQDKTGGRGTYGRLWSSTAANNTNAFRFGYAVNEVTPVKNYNKWDAFAMRCIVKNTTITTDWLTGFDAINDAPDDLQSS